MVTPREDHFVVVHEATSTLKEWHSIWISLYLDNHTSLFNDTTKCLKNLIDQRNRLVSSIRAPLVKGLSQQIDELKKDIVTQIDHGNRLLNLDLVLREPDHRFVSPIELSPIRLYQLHTAAAQNILNESPNQNNKPNSNGDICDNSINGPTNDVTSHNNNNNNSIFQPSSNYNISNNSAPQQQTGKTNSHLKVTLSGYLLNNLPADDIIELHLSVVDSVYNKDNGYNPNVRLLTEKLIIQMEQERITYGIGSTIFTNLGQLINRDICLYVQVYRIGRMILIDGNRTGFGKQQSSVNLYVSSQDGSINSLNNPHKYANNTLSRSRHSSIILPDTQPVYKRPFGATMLSLKAMRKNLSARDQCVSIKIGPSNESEFSLLSELYSKRNLSLKINPNLPNVQLDFSIRFLHCNQDMIPDLLSSSLFSITEKRGFPDVIMSGDFRNDLYITLESAEFEKGGKSISKNIEASIMLIDKRGLVIDNCISQGSNCEYMSSYSSCVFYHSNSPKWNESLKINVPLSEFDSAHIRIEFRHCSTKDRDKKFLGFAFLPLSDHDGAVISDNSHDLFIYKCDSQIYEDDSLNLCKYTSLPYGPLAKNHNNNASNTLNKQQAISQNFTHSSREIVTISTSLLSTKLTQNRDLLNLLRWRELVKKNKKDFEETLKKVLEIDGNEIVKFLQDILDTLFDTFTLFSTTGDDYLGLIFKILVHIFLLLEEPEFQHFKPVLDVYVSNHFSATLVYKGLLACLKKCLEHQTDIERHIPIQRCLKSIKYVFQFIVQSKLLYTKATGEQIDEAFLEDIRHLFQNFETMLARDDADLIPIQVTFLEHFPHTLEQLVKIIHPLELAKYITLLADTINLLRPAPLGRALIIFMRETSNSGLIKNQDVRVHIIETFSKHLNPYINHSRELDLCYQVLEILIGKIHNYHWPSIFRLYNLTHPMMMKLVNVDNQLPPSIITVGEIHQLTSMTKQIVVQGHNHNQNLELAIVSLSKELEPFINLMDSMLSLLDRLLKDPSVDRILVQRYSTCLLTILKLMSRNSFELFMKKRQVDYQRLCSLFRSCRALYNRDWSIMQLTSYSILEYPISEIFQDINIKSDSYPFNKQLSSYINLLADYVTHPTLQLESFSDRKKEYILNVFGDLRIKYASQLVKFWMDLPRSAISDLIPTTIQAFLDSALLPNETLQSLLIPIFYDMIDAEETIKANSRQFERCLIDNIDLFLNLDRGSFQFVDNFANILQGLITSRSPSWSQQGMKMIKSSTTLMKLLINYRKSIDNCQESQTKRMTCLVDLLNFYKEDRIDLHVKYLFKLCDMHLESANYVEAAFTLKMYSDKLHWDCRILNPLEGFRQEEQEWKRKEAIYHKIINYFDQGKCWEEAIPLCKELAKIYEDFLIDYEKWSKILQRLSRFADNILNEHRPEIEYFRIEFFGSDLSDFIKDKEFVCRAGGYERLPSFIARMSMEFPDVAILNYKSKQMISKTCPGKYMFISTVKAVPSLNEQFKNTQRNINDKIIHYYMNNRLDTFSYDIPIMKNQQSKDKSPEANVRNLWVGRYTLRTRNQLPDILSWSQVVSQTFIEISPIENAIETITSMNSELSKLILSFKNDQNKQLRPLTMRLQGVIEAPVNGGASVFINAFLRKPTTNTTNITNNNNNNNNDTDHESILRLQKLIKQQFTILETGLALHGKLAPPEVMPLHLMLVDRLKEMMKPIEDSINPNQLHHD